MIYDHINRLRYGIYAEMGHTAPLAALDADDWTEDEVMGRNLGDGNVDWCVDILDGDASCGSSPPVMSWLRP